MWDGTAFSGTKIALIRGDEVITYLRDDKAGIPYPGMWDLPGGGREAQETPIACAVREVEEEFGLTIDPNRVQRLTRYAGMGMGMGGGGGGLDTWFCIAEVSADEVEKVRFGDEGQRWALMAVDDFLNHDNAVPVLQARLRAVLMAQDGACPQTIAGQPMPVATKSLPAGPTGCE